MPRKRREVSPVRKTNFPHLKHDIMDSARGTALPNLPTLWADTPVVVGDRNLDEAIVTLQTGFRIRGRIEFEGAAQKPLFPSCFISED